MIVAGQTHHLTIRRCKNWPARHACPMPQITAIRRRNPNCRDAALSRPSECGCASAFSARPDALSDYELLEMVLFTASRGVT